MRTRIARVENTLPPREAIATFLSEIVERSLENRLGCLLVNSALEVAPHDQDIADIVAARMGELEAFFRRCMIVGQRDGSISPDVDAKDGARLLLTTVMGLRVLGRWSRKGSHRRRWAIATTCAGRAMHSEGRPPPPSRTLRSAPAATRNRPVPLSCPCRIAPGPLHLGAPLTITYSVFSLAARPAGLSTRARRLVPRR